VNTIILANCQHETELNTIGVDALIFLAEREVSEAPIVWQVNMNTGFKQLLLSDSIIQLDQNEPNVFEVI